MINQKQKNKMLFIFCAVAVLLIISLSFFINLPNVKAESVSKDHSIYSSANCTMYANKRNIGTIRLTTYLHFKEDGNFLIYAQVQIVPKTDDGSNRYRFNSLELNVTYAEQNESMVVYETKTNSVNPIITTTNGTSTTVSNEGVKYEFNSSTTISAESGSVNINQINNEILPNVGSVDKTFRISANNKETSKVYSPAIAIFGKNRTPNNMSAFIIEVKSLDVTGLVFAPNFEANSNKWFRIVGMGNAKSEISSQLQIDGNGGADYYTELTYGEEVYLEGNKV